MPAHRIPSAIACAMLVLLSGCMSTDLTPYQADSANALEPDEQRLWARSLEEENVLDQSGFRASLPACEAYLNRIVARLKPDPLPNGTTYHVRILIDPTINAFALPNGVVYVHSGLITQLENEAQLATVLGHELTHTTHRHGLKSLRKAKNASAFYASITVGTYGLGAFIGGIGATASISGYSQDLERDADQGGFDHMIAAGYDPRESVKTFVILRDEAKRSNIKEPFFFGSHPRLEERIASFNALIQALPEARRAGDTETVAYNRELLPVFKLDAEAALQAGDFEQVRISVARIIAQTPGDASARLLLAESLRKRNGPGDLKTARDSLESITHDDPSLAAAWRELGLVQMKSGAQAESNRCFARYLELSPQAADRVYIESFIKP